MSRNPRYRAALALTAAAAFGAAAWTALDPGRGGLSLLLVALALIAFGASWLELAPGTTKELALIATLAGVAAAGRVLLAAIPGVQPVTVVTMAAGAALGPRAGMAVGALSALASNMILGQGVWTPWQMLGWGLCGVVGAAAGGLLRSRVAFAVLALVLGLVFSAFMDLWMWFSFYPHTWEALVASMVRGFPFQAAHAIGNVLIAFVAGPALLRILDRYAARLRTELAWA